LKPFSSNLEYVTSTVEYLRTLAWKRLVERRLAAKEAGVRGREKIRAKETRNRPEAEDASLPQLQRSCLRLRCEVEERCRELAARIEATVAKGGPELHLEELARKHGLCEFEKLVLAFVLGPNLDDAFRRIAEEISESRTLELHAILDVLCNTLEEKIKARRYFVHSGNLLGKGLLNLSYSPDTSTEYGFMTMTLELPRRVSSLILGEYDVDDQITTFSSVVDPDVELDQVVLPQEKKAELLQLLSTREAYLAARKEWGFDRILPYGKGLVMLFSGPSGTGKTMLAHAVARATGHRLMLLDIRKLTSQTKSDLEDGLRRAFHEARLQHAILFFDEADEMLGDRAWCSGVPPLLREFERLDGIAILATNRRQALDEALDRRILYKLDLEVPTPEQREEIWRKHLPAEAPLADDVDVRALAEEFDFSGGFIKNAVLLAMNRAVQREGEERQITHADLRAGARLQLRNRLEAHTDKVTPRVGLTDVVLPGDVRGHIEEVIAAARKRSTVFSTWGFGRKMSMGKALSVLLVGESGVGKTMCAEAIACELGQNLYPVRMPSVVSCYVDETAKNLAGVFKAAKEAQAILFFDEADALFASRLNEGNHHAHYINQQINSLLTEIEKYDGVVILATNRPDAFDKAFERRIRYRVTLPAPDHEARERIWRSLIPADAPVAEDVDFAALGRDYDFTGGTIRNIILRAAFAAATDGQLITEDILRRCADEECPLDHRARIGFARESRH